jgi:hypothetical protein
MSAQGETIQNKNIAMEPRQKYQGWRDEGDITKRKFEGKDSGFRVRGRAVDQKKVERYKRKKPNLENELLSQLSPAAGEHFVPCPN